MRVPRSGALRARETLQLAMAGAMAAGAVHVGYVLVRVHLLGRFTNTSREFPWFSPLTYLACFLVVAVPVALLAMRWPTLSSPRLQGALFGGLASLAMLLNATALHPAAQLLLSLGVGIQCGRWLSNDLGRNLRRAWSVALVLAAALFMAGVPEIVIERARQRFDLAALPAARADAPNVILLILDTVRAANLSVYGHARPTTPVLEQVAREGTTFNAAMSTAPWTAPSHASLLTGRYPLHSGISYLSPMSDSVPTVTSVFRAKGYATGAFMGNAGYGGRLTGFDRDFIRYEDYPATVAQALWSATFTQLDVTQRLVEAIRSKELWRVRRAITGSQFRIIGVRRGDKNSADEIVDNFLAWREGVGQRPYFAMLNFIDAHDPYVTPFQTRFNEGRRDVDQYDGAIAFTDSIIGSLLRRLASRGELDRTIFVVTSDHGEHFGEHRLVRHGNSLYRELLHVPLLMRAPGRVPAGRRVDQVVSLRDVPSTLLELAGVANPNILGRSLSVTWNDSGPRDVSPAISETERPVNMVNRWPTAYGPMKSLVTDSVHYIRRGDGLEQLFAWRGDTTGRGDLDRSSSGDSVRIASRATLRRVLGPEWTRRTLP